MIESTIIPVAQNLEFRSAVHEMRRNSRTFAEFFAGIGLTHLGLARHGWECVYANDIEPKKKRMYEAQFGAADYYHVEDIWKTKKITSRITETEIDLATASFPCVDLSLAGNLYAGDQYMGAPSFRVLCERVGRAFHQARDRIFSFADPGALITTRPLSS